MTTAEPAQLTIDGEEVAVAHVTRSALRMPLTDLQSDVLRFARLHGGFVTCTQAGIMVHRARGGHCARHEGEGRCCKYAATDGLEMLKRLMRRGLIERIGKVGGGMYSVVGH